MKIDYVFLKDVLMVFENYEKHEIENIKLAKNIGLDFNNIDKSLLDKFIGHIKILGDNLCIESSSPTFGFSHNVRSDNYIVVSAIYRLTQQGYEFLEILKQKTIVEKIKNLSISSAIEIGKPLLVEFLKKQLIG